MRLSGLLVGIGLASCSHTAAPPKGQTQFLEPLLLKKASAAQRATTQPATAAPAAPPHISFRNQRELCEQTTYPTFSFTGKLGQAIHKMMTDSSHLNGVAIGGFIIRGELLNDPLVKVDAKTINAVDLIDLICAQIGASWEIGTHANILWKSPLPSDVRAP